MDSDLYMRHQRGLSMIGFLFVAAVLMVCALLAFRMIPAYIEYYTVQRALEESLGSTNDLSQTTIRRNVERKLNADYVDSVTAKDVQVTKNGNKVTASVSWETKLPLVHNVSLLMEFNAEASR
jgi:Tfp pilus assembly protein PilV